MVRSPFPIALLLALLRGLEPGAPPSGGEASSPMGHLPRQGASSPVGHHSGVGAYPAPAASPLEEAVRRDLAASAATGAVLVLVDADGPRRIEAMGFLDQERSRPMPASYRFHLGSMGDLLMASVGLGLVAEGALDPATPVGRLVPGLSPRVGVLRLESLLLHTGGLDASALVAAPPGEAAPRLSPEESLSRLNDGVVMAPADWIRSPSQHHRLLAGALVEAAAGVSLAELVELRYAGPLGLRGIISATPGSAPDGAEPGFQLARGPEGPYAAAPFPEPSVLQPQERFWTPAADLARIVTHWLATPEHLLALATPRVPDPGAGLAGGAHAPGFRVDPGAPGSPPVWSASGEGPGHTVSLHLFPAQGAAILLLANGGASHLPRTLEVLTAELLAIPDLPPSPPTLKALVELPLPSLDRARLEPMEDPVPELAGSYRNGSRSLTLAWTGDRLVVDTGLPDPLPLRSGEDGFFLATIPDGRVAMAVRILRNHVGETFAVVDGLALRKAPP